MADFTHVDVLGNVSGFDACEEMKRRQEEGATSDLCVCVRCVYCVYGLVRVCVLGVRLAHSLVVYLSLYGGN